MCNSALVKNFWHQVQKFHIVIGSNDGIVRIWEQNAGSLVDAYQTSDKGFPVNALAWVQDSSRLHILSVCVDGSLTYYDAKTSNFKI